jgi:hypothetical protein
MHAAFLVLRFKGNPVKYIDEISAILDQIYEGGVGLSVQVDLLLTGEWNALRSDFILSGVRSATLNLLSDNEGNHQEQLAHALLGDLSPRGALFQYAATRAKRQKGIYGRIAHP